MSVAFTAYAQSAAVSTAAWPTLVPPPAVTPPPAATAIGTTPMPGVYGIPVPPLVGMRRHFYDATPYIASRLSSAIALAGRNDEARMRAQRNFFKALIFGLRHNARVRSIRALEIGFGKAYDVIDALTSMGIRVTATEVDSRHLAALAKERRGLVASGLLTPIHALKFTRRHANGTSSYNLVVVNLPYPFEGVPDIIRKVIEDAIAMHGYLVVVSEERETYIDPYLADQRWRKIVVGPTNRHQLFRSNYFYVNPKFGTRTAVFERVR
jgi:hypothetical protein